MDNLFKMLEWQIAMGVDETINDTVDKMQIIKDNAPEAVAVIKQDAPIAEDIDTHKLVENCKTIEDLREVVQNFTGLSISQTATNTVFSDGVSDAKIMLVGEAPGEEEDLVGIPFCGSSGELLTSALGYVGIDRAKNLYITNTIYWRPPGNRTPTMRENKICLPFIEKHIAIVNPDIVILCGANALATVMGKEHKITKTHGKELVYSNQYMDRDVVAFPIFHPSFLLRQPTRKKELWFDLLKLSEIVEKTKNS